jgi:hypothetical protein
VVVLLVIIKPIMKIAWWVFMGVWIGAMPWCRAQSTGVEVSYQGGYNIPIHPRYPAVQQLAQGVEIAVLHQAKQERLWAVLHKRPQIAYLLGVQTLGNDHVLGQAFYAVPSLNFRVFRLGKFEGQFRIGWGLAYLSQSFHSIYNPSNIVMGSRWNACATVRFLARYAITPAWRIVLGMNATHYSNGGFVTPNLGINIPALQVGVQYEWGQAIATRDTFRQQFLSALPPYAKGVRPFVRVALGGTEIATSQGVKYPIYGITLGVSKLLARTSKLRLAVDYLYNTAPRAFDQHQGLRILQHWDYARLSIMAGHELLFGHWGLLSNLGVYLNNHRLQRSLLTAELGFNFYSRNYLKQQGQQFWLGCHVRTYGGEAEFVQVVLGFQW